MQIDAVGVLQPHLAFALFAHGPPRARLSINAVKVFESVEVVHAAGGIERRNPDSPDPQAAKFERIAPAAEVQGSSADSAAADKRDLHLMDADATGSSRGGRTLRERAGRENAQDRQPRNKLAGHTTTRSDEHRYFLAKDAEKQLLLQEEPDVPGHPSRVFEYLRLELRAARPRMLRQNSEAQSALGCILLRSSGDIVALYPHSEFLSQMSALVD